MTQLDEPPAPRKVARSMLRFFRTSPPPIVVAPAPIETTPVIALPLVRVPADRAAHLDDQHLVFWNAEVSRASAAQLSAAAAAWHHALAQRPAVVAPELPRLTHA